jgi:tripartite-type tricarboxylate transporter receptor subunit TctC
MRIIPAIIVATSLLLGHASAQEWPSRPVRIIVPFAAGGAADALGRVIARHLGDAYRQTFIVENRTGAGGLIGAAAVAASPPDGYSLVISGVASHVIAPVASANPVFDPMRDFTHIAYLGGPPIVLVVNPQLGVATYPDFVKSVKSNPEGMGYVSAGVGTHAHLVAEYVARKEGLKLTHIPYKGSVPALADLIAGHVKVGVMTWSSPAPHFSTGRVRPLAVSTSQRPAGYPDIPTFKELGRDDLVAETWFSLSGPARMPQPIVASLNREVAKILQMDDVRSLLAKDGIEVRAMTPDAFTAFVEGEYSRWSPIARSLLTANN